MKYRNILLTGGRGFIGFNALMRWKKQYPELNFVSLDACTYADRFMIDEKNKWLEENGIQSYVVDLGGDESESRLDDIILSHGIDAIVDFHSESHVDNSIKNPMVFFQSNIIGAAHVFNTARKHGIRVHYVSTDEIYGETTPSDWFDSTGVIPPLKKQIIPSSPYSASKASADMLALSYFRTFGMSVTISRCTNNAGAWQMTEKLLPTVILKALKNEKIPVYGNGLQKRHWIHVDDHNDAIMKILQTGEFGKVYNIGPVNRNWITNIDMIKFILRYLNRNEDLIDI